MLAIRKKTTYLPAEGGGGLCLNISLCLGVQGRGSLVKYHNAGLAQQRARNGNPLLFPARELQAALADQRSVALGKTSDSVVDLGQPGRLLNGVVRRTDESVADVVAHGIVEEDRVLRHHADGGA